METHNPFKTSENIFLTGAAGTGKTTFLNRYIKWCEEEGITVALTASTGKAATSIGGVTVHSYLGLGHSRDINEWLLNNPKGVSVKVVSRCDIDAMIIDEISMMTGQQIDLINYILQEAKNNFEPFGGIKMVFSGDFLQLPPISKGNEVKYAWESNSWGKAEFTTLNLTKIFRQEDDEFLKVLKTLRVGRYDHKILKYLEGFRISREESYNDEYSKYLKLFSKNIALEEYNQGELDKLEGEEFKFESKLNIRRPKEEKWIKSYKNNLPAREELILKEGARVMLTINDTEKYKYFNGSLGTVENIIRGQGVNIKLDNGENIFIEPYTWELKAPITKRKANEFGVKLPETTMEVILDYTQLPLKLAYGLTIHKAQGMTIDSLIIDCSNIWSEGQLYVALSRARDPKKLKLINFQPRQIKSSKKAIGFYEGINKKT